MCIIRDFVGDFCEFTVPVHDQKGLNDYVRLVRAIIREVSRD